VGGRAGGGTEVGRTGTAAEQGLGDGDSSRIETWAFGLQSGKAYFAAGHETQELQPLHCVMPAARVPAGPCFTSLRTRALYVPP